MHVIVGIALIFSTLVPPMKPIGIAENQKKSRLNRSNSILMNLLNQLLATVVALLQSLLGGL